MIGCRVLREFHFSNSSSSLKRPQSHSTGHLQRSNLFFDRINAVFLVLVQPHAAGCGMMFYIHFATVLR